MGSRCPQAGSTDDQDEDCLFLNIQRPTTEANSKKLPVLVFFHGGGFESGSGNVNDPSDLIEIGKKYKQPVLVVRINYRLGLFGFLASSELEKERNSDPKNVALNLGFQDMKRAILWVKEHIDAFGGDAERLTIWGQSAG
jgi:carboxylesterase type B